jgi:hypothetical protein
VLSGDKIFLISLAEGVVRSEVEAPTELLLGKVKAVDGVVEGAWCGADGGQFGEKPDAGVYAAEAAGG